MTNKLAVCPTCSTVNRLPPDRPAEKAKCARCGAHLFDGHPHEVTEASFDRQVGRSTVPVLVDVWAPWCGPCHAMAPAFAEAARQLEPDVRLVKLNSDAAPQAANRLQIRGIPTMILFQDGRERSRISGAMSTGQIVGWVRSQL